MYIGENITYLRNRKGLTQGQLADELGLKRTNIAGYETGKAMPPIEALVKIAQYFAVSLDEIVLKRFESQYKEIVDSVINQVLAERGVTLSPFNMGRLVNEAVATASKSEGEIEEVLRVATNIHLNVILSGH